MTSLLLGIGLLSLAMIAFEASWPGNAGQRRLRLGWRLDLGYWFFTVLITKPIAQIAVVVALAPLVVLTGSESFEVLLKGRGPIGRQPPFLQVAQMIVLIDFIGYWLHRAFHQRKLWPFHAIHHTAPLSWIGSPRRACIRSMTFSTRAYKRCSLSRWGTSPCFWQARYPSLRYTPYFSMPTSSGVLVHCVPCWRVHAFIGGTMRR